MATKPLSGETSKQHLSSAIKSSTSTDAQEYVVRIPQSKQSRFNVMRFSHSHKVDVTKWSQIKMERENNMKEFKADDEQPKYGAGSEFGREQREESRRKKYGIVSKKYNPEDQPWLLTIGGKGGKKFKGIREGGVTENASYYIFTQAANGVFEAYPVAEWYNFSPIQRYKALSAEEAEEEFERRDKVYNLFSIMVRKRLQKEAKEEDDEDDKQNKQKNKKQTKEFKITDMDDWARDSSDSEKEGEEAEETKATKKPGKKGKDKKKKKKKEDESDNEGLEESDEGDFDSRHVEYMTGSSSSGEELEDEKANNQLKGVEDEEALRKLHNSEDEEEEEEENKTEENQEKEKTPEQQKPKPKQKKEGKDSSDDTSSDSSDSDFDDAKIHTAVFMQKAGKKNGSDNSAGSSRANTPTRFADGKEGSKGTKRKLTEAAASNVKRTKMDSSGTTFVNSLDSINEESIRRYLSRKPMTASDLLHKFKSKKTKMSSDQLVTRIADVLKRMDLVKHNVKGKLYLSLKN